MRKNKIFKRVLAFASTFIVLLSLCATIAFAQAPEISTNNNSNLTYVNVLAYDDLDLSQDDNVIAYFHLLVTNDTKRLFSINCVLTDYYYQEFYSNDYDIYLELPIENITISSHTGTYGGPSNTYYDLDVVSAVNSFAHLFLSNSGEQLNILNNTLLLNIVSNSIDDQFTYWETEVENAFNDGYAIGQNEGYSEGQNDGYNIGYVDGTTVGYTNALNDFDMFERGLFDIFNAPFIFVRNIVGFEIFGITISDVIIGVLLLCLGFVLIKFIGGAIPL